MVFFIAIFLILAGTAMFGYGAYETITRILEALLFNILRKELILRSKNPEERKLYQADIQLYFILIFTGIALMFSGLATALYHF